MSADALFFFMKIMEWFRRYEGGFPSLRVIHGMGRYIMNNELRKIKEQYEKKASIKISDENFLWWAMKNGITGK